MIHERAHSGEVETRPGVLIRRSLAVRSFRLGISGQLDIVEFHPAASRDEGAVIPGRKGFWRPLPIEYKRSRDRAGSDAYRVQLCAQALCLEEMLATPVPEGCVYDAAKRHRQHVPFDAELRSRTKALAARMAELYRLMKTPPPVLTAACRNCSLVEDCQPEALIRNAGSVAAYLASAVRWERDP
jgi:CRISPR-associated exonuclease Cas4